MRFASKPQRQVDVVVVGGGPAGSVTAARLANAGLSVLVLERHIFPRYHIGESLTATAAQVIREFGLAEHMERHDFPVKTGVKVIGQNARSEFFVPAAQDAWQVRRAEYDKVLLDHAISCGANHLYGSVKQILTEGDRVVGVAYKGEHSRSDVLQEVRARFVVDASGHSTLFSRLKIASPRRVETFGRQIALFTQVKHAVRDSGEMGNNTFIFYDKKHHWSWFIPVSTELTSIGVVIPVSSYRQCGGSPQDVMAWGTANINPEFTSRLEDAVAVEPVRVIRNYSYRVERFVGDGWLCVGDSHQFTDPIFSFGVAFAMTEATAAAAAILQAIEEGSCREPFESYARYCDRGQLAASDLIRYFWKFPAFFSFQTRGRSRKDLIRLFSGDCFTEDEIPALTDMRRSLAEVRLNKIAEDRGREIAACVHQRYADFQGVEAAFIRVDGDGICLTFLLADDDIDLYDHLCGFEEELYTQFGRDDLAIISYTPGLMDGMRQIGARRTFAKERGAEEARVLFDHRASE